MFEGYTNEELARWDACGVALRRLFRSDPRFPVRAAALAAMAGAPVEERLFHRLQRACDSISEQARLYGPKDD